MPTPCRQDSRVPSLPALSTWAAGQHRIAGYHHSEQLAGLSLGQIAVIKRIRLDRDWQMNGCCTTEVEICAQMGWTLLWALQCGFAEECMKNVWRSFTEPSHHQKAKPAPKGYRRCALGPCSVSLAPSRTECAPSGWRETNQNHAAFTGGLLLLCQGSVKSVLVGCVGLINVIPFPSAPRLQPCYREQLVELRMETSFTGAGGHRVGPCYHSSWTS